jgi:NAD(P)-dependent dehydrogenase (short-subunit alcohol dehydrogenase family)
MTPTCAGTSTTSAGDDRDRRVNAVCPGTIPQGEGRGAPEWDELLRSGRVPTQRTGTRDEVASVELFLASDASSFTTA